MYNLRKLDPSKWQDSPILSQYVNDLPDKPYCSYVKGFTEIRTKRRAIERVYIQPNPPVRVNYIVLDIDHHNGIHTALYDNEMPPPQLIVQNQVNAHVHLAYKLADPVYMWGKAKCAPIRLLARVEHGMTQRLGADASYGGNLMKNPLSDVWTTYTTDAPIEGYSLEQLGRFVSLDFIPTTEDSEASGYGRNCTLFDHVRPYGYHIASSSYNAIVSELKPIADNFNQQFAVPLFDNEVMHIVRSIARYCSRMDFSKSHQAFSETQSVRSKRRWGDSTKDKKQAQEWADEGMKKTVIAERLGVTVRTLTRWGIRKNKK